MFERRRFWYICIGVVMAVHIGIATAYAPLPDDPGMFEWINVAQRFGPALVLILLWTKLQRVLNPVLNVKFWTITCLTVAAVTFVTYFAVGEQRWFAWTTLGLLIVLMAFVANSQPRLPNTSRWLLGAMVVLFAMGVWECLYQIGLWVFYDFFGCSFTNFYVTIALQFTWIVPALIVILVLYQRGLRFRIPNSALVCLAISVAATIVWFATGMDIPLLFWEGQFVAVNEAARPLLISVSRASQSFWLVGVALILATPKEVMGRS